MFLVFDTVADADTFYNKLIEIHDKGGPETGINLLDILPRTKFTNVVKPPAPPEEPPKEPPVPP